MCCAVATSPSRKFVIRSKAVYFKEYYQKGEINWKNKKGDKPDSKLVPDINLVFGALPEISEWMLTHVQRDGKNLKVGKP
jgi:hypothetical protein